MRVGMTICHEWPFSCGVLTWGRNSLVIGIASGAEVIFLFIFKSKVRIGAKEHNKVPTQYLSPVHIDDKKIIILNKLFFKN